MVQYHFIMKNLFSNLGAFCSGLLICVAVIACANDTDDNTGNSIEVLSLQIAELTERVKSLENNMNNIEEELDYDIIFQKLGGLSSCDCSGDIEEIKNQLATLGTAGKTPLPTKFEAHQYDGDYEYIYLNDAKYDEEGRLISLICKYKEIAPDPSYNRSSTRTYTISYNENVCTIKVGSNTYTHTFSEDVKNDYKAINYYLLSVLYD